MSETEAQHFAEHRRRREIDEVAVRIGLAYTTEQHGHSGELFRKGYEAGLSAPRGPQDLAQIRSLNLKETPELLAALKKAAETPGVIVPIPQLRLGICSDETACAPVARYVAYRPCGCFQGAADVGSPDRNNSASNYIARWVRDGCVVKPLPADAFYTTDPCPAHNWQKGG